MIRIPIITFRILEGVADRYHFPLLHPNNLNYGGLNGALKHEYTFADVPSTALFLEHSLEEALASAGPHFDYEAALVEGLKILAQDLELEDPEVSHLGPIVETMLLNSVLPQL